MKKKRNIVKRNSGFIVGCVLAAGASFVTADTIMERGMPELLTPATDELETATPQTVAAEKSETRTYETDAFTVTASGNIIKGVETEAETERQTETPQTDENGNPVDTATEEDGSSSGQDSDGGGDSGTSAGDYTSDGGYSGGGYSDGSYSDSGYSDSSSGGDAYYGQSIEIYDTGNGDYYYSDDGSSGGSSDGSGGWSDGSGGSDSSSDSSGSSGSSSDNIIIEGGTSTPDDVILWGISSRYIDESELYNYSAAELRLIRNEIFALHGRIFNSQDLRDYFSQKSWYVPMYAPEDFDANMFYYLNDYEEANLNVILNYEAALAGY